MPTGVFAVLCIECETHLVFAEDAKGRCPSCGQEYFYRFGHLIPVDTAGSTTHRPSNLLPGGVA